VSLPASHPTRNLISRSSRLLAALLLSLASAHGQGYDITPLFGGMFGGSVKLEQEGVPNFHANLQDSFVFGVAGGIRIDAEDCEKCALIEFRWTRQDTHLTLKQDPLVPTPYAAGATTFRPAVTIDRYLGDFTYEFVQEDVPYLRPYIIASLGAAHISAPAAGATRFVFGIGTGIKIFPKPHWGFRLQVEYLPIVMQGAAQRIVCTTGCVVSLSGGLANQLEATFGPVFRF
jgi:hypothetical protein